MAKRARKPDNLDRYNAGVPVEIAPMDLLDMVGAFGGNIGQFGKRGNALVQMMLNPRTAAAPAPKGEHLGVTALKNPKKADIDFRLTDDPINQHMQPVVPTYKGGAGGDAIYAAPYGRAVQYNDDIAEMTPYLRASEIQAMPETPRKMRALQNVVDYPTGAGQQKYVSPRHDANLSPDHIYNMALAGSAKKGWYEASYATLQEVFGPDDGNRFAALLAATSPQTSVESNLINSLNIWKNWTAAGRPTDPAQITAIMGASVQGGKGEESVMEAWENNTITALTTPEPLETKLSGPKVDSFMRNLQGDYDAVTNDTWMGRAYNILQDAFSGSGGEATAGYYSANHNARVAAQMLTNETGYQWTPANVQEAVWSYVKTLMDYKNSKEAEGQTARDLVEADAITGSMVASTPDFATLFQDPTYAQPLIDAGILQVANGQIGRATEQGFTPIQTRSFGTQEMPPPNQDMLLDTAVMLDDIDRSDLDMDVVNFPYETTPYANAGHLPELLEDEQLRQDYYEDPRSDFIPEGMSRDVLAAGLGDRRTQPNRAGTGVWTPEGGSTEFNPVTTPSITKPVPDSESEEAGAQRRSDYDMLSMYRAAMGAQGGVGWHQPIPERNPKAPTDSAQIYYPKALMPQQLEALQNRYPNVILSDTGTSIVAFPFDDVDAKRQGRGDIEKILADSEYLEEMLGTGTKARPMVVRQFAEKEKYFANNPDTPEFPGANRYAGYADLESQWQTPGKGKVTRRLLKSAKSASPEYRKYLESAPSRAAIQDLYELDAEMGEKGYETRPDLQLMRKRFIEGGFEGLRKSLRAGEPLADMSALERFRAFG